jgi:cytochrome b6-f complex iron-sulfur subunit
MDATPALVSPAHGPLAVASDSPARRRISRRRLLAASFWTGIVAMSAGVLTTVANMVWPRRVSPFGGPVGVLPGEIPRPGDPPRRNFDGHFLLVNLEPDEGRIAGNDTPAPGGLLALWWKCPHLGCTVPWNGSFRLPQDPLGRVGWFRCPCHMSTYTRARVRVFGPATRSMDTMAISVTADGSLIVDSGAITPGDTDNPSRAVPWPPA